jgi:hypothetical protein
MTRQFLVLVTGLGLIAVSGIGLFSEPAMIASRPRGGDEDTRHLDFELRPATGVRELEAVFRLTNRGELPLRILDVERSCACTETEVNKAVIAPGDHAVLTAKVRISPYERWKTIHCVVLTDDHANARRSFTAAFRVVEPVSLSEEWHDFGTLRLGEATNHKLVLLVSRTDDRPPRLLSIHADASEVSFSASNHWMREDDVSAPGAWRLPIVAQFSPSARTSAGSFPVTLTVNVDDERTKLDFIIRWERFNTFAVTPGRVIFSARSMEGIFAPASVTIRRFDRAPFRVVRCESENPLISSSFDSECTSESAKIAIYHVGIPACIDRGTCVLKVFTDDIDAPLIEIPVTILATPP